MKRDSASKPKLATATAQVALIALAGVALSAGVATPTSAASHADLTTTIATKTDSLETHRDSTAVSSDAPNEQGARSSGDFSVPGHRADGDPVIGIPIHLPEVEGVKDPIFSVLIGLVETNAYGTVTQQQLEQHLQRANRKSKLPYQAVLQVTRLPSGVDRPTTEIEVLFEKDLRLPIPYSVLGYNPGSFRASQRCLFREWELGEIVVTHREQKDGAIQEVPIVLHKVHLYGLVDGELELDIDGWIDSMMGGNLDDTGIVGLMLCLYNDEWHGVAMGYNDDHKGRSGALSFREDKVVFPSPPEMKTLGRTMRSWVESLMASAAK